MGVVSSVVAPPPDSSPPADGKDPSTVSSSEIPRKSCNGLAEASYKRNKCVQQLVKTVTVRSRNRFWEASLTKNGRLKET